MSSPMVPIPDHLRFPLNAEGHGPATGDDFDHWGCWCSDPDCTRWQITDVVPSAITPREQKLVVFTEPDCKVIVRALDFYAKEYTGDSELSRINRLIERLS